MAKPSGRESDPLTGFTFRLELEGRAQGYFTEVNGLGSENDVIEQKVVDEGGHDLVQKIPGRLKWGDITLKRGITDDMKLWDWRQLVIDGKMKDARQNCSIIMLDRNYEDVARWDFNNAWPSKITGPNLKSDSNELGIEEMVLVHEGIKRKN
jgi:phage tail-like protein